MNAKWTRRKFIVNATAASSAILISPLISCKSNKYATNKTAKIIAKTIGIDTHNHIDVPLQAATFPELEMDLAGGIKKSGLSAICMTFQVDRPKLTEPGQAYERFVAVLDNMDEVLKKNNLTRSLTLADLKSAHEQQKPTVIQAVEGGHFLEGEISRLDYAYQRGLRLLCLLHDEPSLVVPLGDIYTKPPIHGGLTDFGKEVVKECNRLGIVIDLTHCSNDAINDALKISTQPMLTSHTGLDYLLGDDEKIAKMMKPRLISKEQAKIVADAGSIIGVWTHLAGSPMEYVQNIREMVNVAGIDHVCIGTDTKIAKAANSNERPGEKTNAAWENQKEGFLYSVVSEMLNQGFSEKEITKIVGGNFCRVFDAVTSRG